jgi:hypothetical protein
MQRGVGVLLLLGSLMFCLHGLVFGHLGLELLAPAVTNRQRKHPN